MEDSARTPAWRAAGQWALKVLAAELGPTWPVQAVNQFGEIPLPLVLASGHTVAYAQTLELALRLHLLRDVSGFADARNEIKGDRRVDRAMHFSLQMEVAGVAHSCGWPVSLEQGRPVPADVTIESPAGPLVVELKVLGPSEQAKIRGQQIDKAFGHLRGQALGMGVCVGGTLHAVPSDAEIDAAVDWVARSAAFVSNGGVLPPFTDGAMRLELVRADQPDLPGLSGPTEDENLLRRLVRAIADKSQRMQTSGAGWLRLDAITGIWALTEWGCNPMSVKVPMLESFVLDLFDGQPPIDGVIVCSGAAFFNGTVNEERSHLASGAVGLRYAVAPMRAREAIIMPLREEARPAVADWLALHEREAGWLEWALAALDLPSEAKLFRAPTP
jgi:hypothetical protein